MPVLHPDDTGIVKELRLRRWAREHHVPTDERSSTWHPIVLDEMRRKDDEDLIRSRSRGPVSSFVPLVPTVIQRMRPPRTASNALVATAGATKRADHPHADITVHVDVVMTPGRGIGSFQTTTMFTN